MNTECRMQNAECRMRNHASRCVTLHAPRWSLALCRAFTMIEIAISLAVIGFALVAILGVLPLGMNVQKENREETIINQDATVFLNAIRNGARGMDDLTNYVMAITNYQTRYGPKLEHRTSPSVLAGTPRTLPDLWPRLRPHQRLSHRWPVEHPQIHSRAAMPKVSSATMSSLLSAP